MWQDAIIRKRESHVRRVWIGCAGTGFESCIFAPSGPGFRIGTAPVPSIASVAPPSGRPQVPTWFMAFSGRCRVSVTCRHSRSVRAGPGGKQIGRRMGNGLEYVGVMGPVDLDRVANTAIKPCIAAFAVDMGDSSAVTALAVGSGSRRRDFGGERRFLAKV